MSSFYGRRALRDSLDKGLKRLARGLGRRETAITGRTVTVTS